MVHWIYEKQLTQLRAELKQLCTELEAEKYRHADAMTVNTRLRAENEELTKAAYTVTVELNELREILKIKSDTPMLDYIAAQARLIKQLKQQLETQKHDTEEYLKDFAEEHKQQVERLRVLLELIKDGDFDKMVDLAESLGIPHEHKREYRWAGDHEMDARHTAPDRESLIWELITRELEEK